MPFPAYVLDCPHCGANLAHHVGPAQDAPWQCFACGRGWWTAELTPAARLAWRPVEQDHLGVDVDTAVAVHEARHDEHLAALARRTSARRDHLPFLTKPQLTALAAFLANAAAVYPKAADLLAEVQQRVTSINAGGA